MTVVISVLLAMLAALFILRTSVDSIGTLSVADEKDLSFAVDTVMTQLNAQLVKDVPGVAGQEYQDYPWTNSSRGPYRIGWNTGDVANYNVRQATTDPCYLQDDRWLASLEPYKNAAGNYFWQHITDLYGDRRYFDAAAEGGRGGFPDAATDVLLDNTAAVIVDGTAIGSAATDFKSKPPLADADGDGVADAMWIPIRAEVTPYDYSYIPTTPTSTTISLPMLRPDENKYLRSAKGRQMYVAMRVVDAGGMINANTAYSFNSTSTVPTDVDGNSVSQVNLFGLAARGSGNTLTQLEDALRGTHAFNLASYESDVAACLDSPVAGYTPFDITEELKLRYRYILNFNKATTRMDHNTGATTLWADVWEGGPTTPWEKGDTLSTNNWPSRVDVSIDPLGNYDYRHLTTTFNCDRIIAPDGTYPLNLEFATAQQIYNQLLKMDTARVLAGKPSIAAAAPDLLPQLAVNIRDYRDTDGSTSPSHLVANGKDYYGHSRPFIWISEVAYSQWLDPAPLGTMHYSYAVELCLPLPVLGTANYRLVVDGNPYPVAIPATANYAVFTNIDPCTPIAINPAAAIAPWDPATSATNSWPWSLAFNAGSVIELQRSVDSGVTWTDVVDRVTVSPLLFPALPLTDTTVGGVSMERDLSYAHIAKKIWTTSLPTPVVTAPSMGTTNLFSYVPGAAPTQTELDMASPLQSDTDSTGNAFVTIGDVGKVLTMATIDIAPTTTEKSGARFDWTSAIWEDFPKYFTVITPPASEDTKVYGRVNINTAPQFVLEQLPWVSTSEQWAFTANTTPPPAYFSTQSVVTTATNHKLAQAIIAYRDKHAITGGPDYTNRDTATALTGLRNDLGLSSIAELTHVVTSAAARGTDPTTAQYKNLTEYGIDWYATDFDPATPPEPMDQAMLPDLTANDSVPNDFEERDLIFSRISNIATVRSDVFCAYILVRLGEDGPQKRYIAILDRSEVSKNQATGLLTGKVRVRALHPVADPR